MGLQDFGEMSGDDHSLLVRLDERTQQMQKQLESHVSHDEFRPVKMVVYGLVSLILTSVLAAVIAVAVKQ